MKHLRQLVIVLILWLIGELINKFFALPIPGNIIGMITLLVLLMLKIIKIEWVDDIGNLILFYMPIFFIPAGVNIISGIPELKKSWITILTISSVSTLITFIVTGFTIEFLLKRGK